MWSLFVQHQPFKRDYFTPHKGITQNKLLPIFIVQANVSIKLIKSDYFHYVEV